MGENGDLLDWSGPLRDGAGIMLWSGELGRVYDEGHQIRIEWASRVAFWSKWGLWERISAGFVVVI